MVARRWLGGTLAVVILAASAAGCRGGAGSRRPGGGRHPWIVIGIDGGEWRVIRHLWEGGRLPHLRAIAARGTSATLRTAYGPSPVIWTTIATGTEPARHGITDFVVPTPRGDVPASSTQRRVPALWNMLSRAGRRVAVLGWWASWPAEEVEGVVFSDRALLDLERRFHAPGLEREVEAALRAAAAGPNPFRGNDSSRAMDQAVTHLARRLAARDFDFDLMLVYYRGVDIASHNDWKSFQPRAFGLAGEPGGDVPAAYEAVDEAIGFILAAAPTYTNVMVVSDHGFQRLRPERVQAVFDLDLVLERLGYTVAGEAGVDFARSRLYTYSSPDARMDKLVRCALAGREPGARLTAGGCRTARQDLERDLGRVRWRSGAPALLVRDARPAEARHGADFVVKVLPRAITPEVELDGAALPGALLEIRRLSGSHGARTHGILLAAGPDVAPGVSLDGISIHDLAPTLLYALGLPVADDFAGRPWTELFTPALRARQPLRRIASWGALGEGAATPSAADAQLLEELGALGYLD
jgi:predicted AlkP superfamily phosphohydrolase/phosphomutase